MPPSPTTLSDEIVPAAAVSEPVPPALPTADTASPTFATSSSALIVVRPDAPVSWSRATSFDGSLPTTVAG